MIRVKHILGVALLSAITFAATAQALSRTTYLGWTSQGPPVRFHGAIHLNLYNFTDVAGNTPLTFVFQFKCRATAKRAPVVSAAAPVNRNGDFKYTNRTHKTWPLSWVSGHVTKTTITGKFAARRLGCRAQGTFSARQGTSYPPEPKP